MDMEHTHTHQTPIINNIFGVEAWQQTQTCNLLLRVEVDTISSLDLGLQDETPKAQEKPINITHSKGHFKLHKRHGLYYNIME